MIRPMRLPTSPKRLYQAALWVVFLAVLVLPFLGSRPAQAAKPTKTPQSNVGNSPYDVLNLVNQLRASKGLAPLQANAELMAAAQKHSEYQATVHSITHYGPGGNSPKDRAAAAGYGGGASFFLSENIYGGSSATAQRAVTWWQGDAPHLSTMLGSQYTDAGAGVATDGSTVYYTLDVGYISGAPGGSGSGSTGGSVAATSLPGTAQATVNPVLMATPMPDGSIVHTVQAGQTLWTIAAIYNVNLQDLLKLNAFNENTLIYVGQKILVKGPDAPPTPTIPPTITPTRTRKPTLIPRHTATEVSLAPQAVESSIPSDSQPAAAQPGIDPILILIGALVAGGLALVVVGSLLNGRKAK